MAIKPVEIVINATDKASPKVKDVARAVDSIDPAAKRAGASADTSLDTVRERSEQAARAAGDVAGKLDTVKNTLLSLAGIDLGAGLVKDLAATADQFNNLQSKIGLVVESEGEIAGVMQQVSAVAKETFSSLDGTTQLFTRLAASAKELNITQDDALGLTRTINQAIQVSGASATASAAALQQLVQGLQSGVLRGDEFNSVMEQAPRLARALADGLGVPIGALRQLAEEGKLTSSAVVSALTGQREQIEAEFTKLPLTIGRAVQNLQTEFIGFVGLLDDTTGASTTVAQGIQGIADQLDVVARLAAAAGAAMTAGLAAQGVAALTAAGGASAVLASNLNNIPKVINIVVAAVGFEVGFQIGEMLTENFELARRLGVGIVEFMQVQLNSLTFLKEAAAAVFTDDTIDAALERYNQRAVEMKAIFAQMYKDAKEPPKAIEEGANKAAKALSFLGSEASRVAREQREAADLLAKSSTTEVEAIQAVALAKKTDAQVTLSGLQVRKDLAKQAETMARLLGDETAVRKALIEQITIEIEITRAKANLSRVEAEGSILVAQAKIEELKASSQLTPLKEAELRASIRLAEAKIAEANATGKSAEVLERQLRILKEGVATDGRRAASTRDLSAAQRDLAGSVDTASDALERQAKINAKYASPLGSDKYSGPEGGSVTGNTREERLAGQNAVDNTLAFRLRDELKAGTLGPEDAEDIKAAIAALDQNEAVNRDLDRFGGAFSTAGAADREEWRNIRTQLAQALTTQKVGQRVAVDINVGGSTETVETDDAGARKLVKALQKAGLAAGR